MSHPGVMPGSQTAGQGHPVPGGEAAVVCPLPPRAQSLEIVAPGLWHVLGEAGCPLASPVRERLHFETLLAELSAAFVNLPAGQVDSAIESSLRRLVEFLGVDRGGLAELVADHKQLVITHSYHVPGVPAQAPLILNEQLPWYAGAIHAGKVLRLARLPEDLPPEATPERAYCTEVGLKSHVMIPLKVVGSVAGAIGFGSFRGYRTWPDDLLQCLRLVGEIFTNALARKHADVALRESEARFRLMAESAPVMVWMSGPDKRCTYFGYAETAVF